MLQQGTQAPRFTLEDMSGAAHSLDQILASGPAVVAFFKISCPVCQFTFPYLERLRAAALSNGFQLYGISQDTAAATSSFRDDCDLGFPLLLDAAAAGYPVSNAYGIRSVPSIFVIEPDGTISATMEGFEKAGLGQLGERLGTAAFQPGEDVPAFRPG